MHTFLNQSLNESTIPEALTLDNEKSKWYVQCTIDRLGSLLEVTTGNLRNRNIHLHTHIASTLDPSPDAQLQWSRMSQKYSFTLNTRVMPRYRFSTINVANVHLSKVAHISGYCAHPAVMDSTFHAGAVMATETSDNIGPMAYIPVALTAINVFGPLSLASSAHAIAEILPKGSKSKSALSGYRLNKAKHTSQCGFHLVELHSQEVEVGMHLSKPPIKSSRGDGFMYCVQWQDASPIEHMLQKNSSTKSRRHRWLDDHLNTSLARQNVATSSLAASCLADIALMQYLLAAPSSMSRASIRLLSTAKLLDDDIAPSRSLSIGKPQDDCNMFGGAIACAIAKVAASEYPNCAWSTVITSPLITKRPLAFGNADAFGVLCYGGSVKQPRILGLQHNVEMDNRQVILPKGKTVVTGGLTGDMTKPFLLVIHGVKHM